METYDVLILGSGLSGLSCAQKLKHAGKKVCVLDKGFNVGGRTASKSVETSFGVAVFDYGAQYFTVDDFDFQVQVNKWIREKVVKKWSVLFSSLNVNEHRGNRIRYRGIPTMRSLCEKMAEGLVVKQLKEVVKLYNYENKSWEAKTSDGELFSSKKLVISAPLTQSLNLCYRSGIIPADNTVTFFNQQKYHSCITIMLVSDSDSLIPEPGGLWFDDLQPIRWAADNKKKGISPITAVTVQLSPSFSKTHFETHDSVILADLYDELKKIVPGKWVKSIFHRWKYSQPTNIVDISYIRDEYYSNLWFTGDVFLNGRVESAWLAGFHTAEAILEFNQDEKNTH